MDRRTAIGSMGLVAAAVAMPIEVAAAPKKRPVDDVNWFPVAVVEKIRFGGRDYYIAQSMYRLDVLPTHFYVLAILPRTHPITYSRECHYGAVPAKYGRRSSTLTQDTTFELSRWMGRHVIPNYMDWVREMHADVLKAERLNPHWIHEPVTRQFNFASDDGYRYRVTKTPPAQRNITERLHKVNWG